MQAIREIAGKERFTTVVGKVVSTEGATCKVVRLLDGKVFDDVRLNATSLAADGLVITPTVGSFVSITTIDGDKWFVSQYSKIDGLTLNVENAVTINGGKNGGMCITPTLKTQLDKMSKRIDGIINAINNGVPVTNPPYSDGGTGLQESIVLALGKLTDKEDFANIENKKIKH
jgi:hypothetical protein